MSVGLFLGTFDPPHIGHVNVVTSALNSDIVDKVIVVPAYKNLWKNTLTSHSIRTTMTECAFKGVPGVVVSDIEATLNNGEPVPSYMTIDWFNENYEGIIITTQETYSEIPKWEKGEEIMANNKFLVICQGHFGDITRREADLAVYAPSISICSTNIRERIRTGQIAIPFISSTVAGIIKTLSMYK